MADPARLVLLGGPFGAQQVGYLPPDRAAPAQIVWSGWTLQGFTAWLYEWRGETYIDGGRTHALIYRPTGRRLGADEIPPSVAGLASAWAEAWAVADVPGVLRPGL